MLQIFGAELTNPETTSVTVTGPADRTANGNCPRRYQLSCILLAAGAIKRLLELLIEKCGVNPTRRVRL